MSPFDAISVRKSFYIAALEAERYLEEIHPRTANQPSYKHLVDEMTAKFYAYDALAARAWKSPADLVAAAQMLLDVEIRDPRAFDHHRVKTYRRKFLDEVVSRYKT